MAFLEDRTMTSAIQSITSIPAPFNMIVLVVLIVTAGSLVGTIATQVRKWACHRQEIEFKRELLDRGMGVEEIERMVQAKGLGADSKTKGHGCGAWK
jgi:hypothetical protein